MMSKIASVVLILAILLQIFNVNIQPVGFCINFSDFRN